MLNDNDIGLPKGRMAKIVDTRHGRIADRNNIWGFKLIDTEYLQEVIDQKSRFWSLDPNTIGSKGSRMEKIAIGSFVMFLGSLNVHNPLLSTRILTYRVVLLGKGVYAVHEDSVEWC